ncbi:unnamed protein product [Litomosoides sigmodontis]|uniref:Uncharacterized protein n=1 Tax=Litomosoides sigmodontis TaxID=42156 RepID=A0A3P6TMM1_LITSI|nr:unnamed protein product [Litomosoides sigmodontis]
MERTNIKQASREAFDWLAENRDQMDSNPRNFANHLITAVGELVVSRELVKKVMKKLMKDKIVTSNEYDKNFRRFESSSDEQLPTVTLISCLLQKNCAYFHVETM